jgi:hypothetical protein
MYHPRNEGKYSGVFPELYNLEKRFRVPHIEAKVSWRDLHNEGNGFYLPFSSFLPLLFSLYFIDLLMFIVILLL